MIILLQISDAAYQRLMANGSRIQGTIGLTSPTEGNFNEHNKSRNASTGQYMKLPHGRASVTKKNVRLSLVVDLDETDILPAQAIEDESRQASAFVDRVFGGGWGINILDADDADNYLSNELSARMKKVHTKSASSESKKLKSRKR